MLKKNIFFILTILSLQTAGFAQVRDYRIDMAQSEIKFSVRATVYTINGKAGEAESRVSFDPETKKVNLPLSIEIPTASLKTRNKLRDRDMRKMFEAEKYPEITWTASKVTCEAGPAPQFLNCQAEGTMKIHGVEKEISFPVELTLRENKVKAEGSLKLKRDDFGLKTPAMLGMIRVSQDVTVSFKTVWEAA